ncbi:MAG: hypothetical protein JWP11_3265 [Frankiales bacterium]|nr:hypothetical protein [Frankiales bacterium]
MTMYDDDRVVTLLREVDLPLSPPDRLGAVTRRARRYESRRMSALAGVMAVVLTAGLVSALSLHNRGGDEQLSVAAAASATRAARTARLTMEIRLSGKDAVGIPGGKYTVSGPVDFEHQRFALKGQIMGQDYETRGIGKDTWIRSPGIPGKTWLHVSQDSAAASEFQRIDPNSLLALLTKNATEQTSTQVGDRTVLALKVRGDVFDPASGSTSPQLVTVTVDDQHRVRKLETTDSFDSVQRAALTLTFDDFGTAVDVQPPPAGQVGEVSDLMGTATSSSGGVQTFSGQLGSSKEACAAMAKQVKDLLARAADAKRAEMKKLFDQALASCGPKR